VKIVKLQAEPWPDNRRVRVYLEITPFLKRPNGEISLLDSQGNQVASVSIIESIEAKMEITMHLQGGDKQGDFKVDAIIYYLEDPINTSEETEANPTKQKHVVVDHAETSFQI
jgi:hypothetical protein